MPVDESRTNHAEAAQRDHDTQRERRELAEIARAADASIGLKGGRLLAPHLIEGPCRAEVRNICTCVNQRIVFYTGEAHRREYSMCLGTSTKAKILAHWAGYTAPSVALRNGCDCALEGPLCATCKASASPALAALVLL